MESNLSYGDYQLLKRIAEGGEDKFVPTAMLHFFVPNNGEYFRLGVNSYSTQGWKVSEWGKAELKLDSKPFPKLSASFDPLHQPFQLCIGEAR